MPRGRIITMAALAIAIAALTCTAFAPSLGNAFVNWDDLRNFLENRAFGDLDGARVRWAFATAHLGVYQPFAWVLLEMEHSLWGLVPAGYHMASILLHAVNAGIFFWLSAALIERASGALRMLPAAFASLLFAVHPLRTEVVAWVSCQPYLLAALFYMLALLAYLRVHAAPEGARARWWVATFLLAAAAMLSKAVAVSLPAVLLIIDVYPLRRPLASRRVLLEKIPFVALAAIFGAAAVWAKSSDNALGSLAADGWGARLHHVARAFTFYLEKTWLPLGLSPVYPVVGEIGLRTPKFLVDTFTLVALGALVFHYGRRGRPALLAGWVAYLVILLPNTGIVSVGDQLGADRYGYLATAPLFVVLAAALGGPWARAAVQRLAARAAAAGLVIMLVGTLGFLSRRQCTVWSDSVTLWRHALAHGGAQSAQVHYNLGEALWSAGLARESLDEAYEASRLTGRDSPIAARIVEGLDRLVTEDPQLLARKALTLQTLGRPQDAEAHLNLGLLLIQRGRPQEALVHFAEMIRLQPENAFAHAHMGHLLLLLEKNAGARAQFLEALRLLPGLPAALDGLARLQRD